MSTAPEQPGAEVSYGPPPPLPKDDLAVTALVTGILALLFGVVGLGLLVSPVALVLGLLSLRNIERSHGQLAGRGQAKAAIVLGVIGCVLLVLLVVAVAVFAADGSPGAAP